MKILEISESALQIRNASLDFGKAFRAVKLSYEQAMAFTGGFNTFDQMLKHYGLGNVLALGEQYTGYVAVYYSSYKQEVVYLTGAVEKISNPRYLLWVSQHYRIGNQETYDVVYEHNGTTTLGGWKYVWTFNQCRFAAWGKELQQGKHLAAEINTEKLDKELKEKLVHALVGNKKLELSDEEYLVLKSYAPDYFRRFFIEAEH